MIEVGEIAAMLARDVEALVRTVLPNGVRQGTEWRVGSIAGERGTSMGVCLAGAKRGIWVDSHHPEHRGDALDLVAAVEFGGDKRRAIVWARGWLGLDQIDLDQLPRVRRQAEAEAEKEARRSAQGDARKRDSAIRMFLAAQERIAGTPVEIYLKGRGIDFAALGRQPRCLRYAPELPDRHTGELHPTMVAAITNSAGYTVAVHRTFLRVHPDGRVTKADVRNENGKNEAKVSLGKYAGGCIRLWRGASGKPLGEAKPGEWVLIGEGIEDTATAVMANPEFRALVAISSGGFLSLKLPDAIEGVFLLTQNEDNEAAAENWSRVATHFQSQGKRVKLVRPPQGVKDINDMVKPDGGLDEPAIDAAIAAGRMLNRGKS
jgi:hypothetical protein